MDYIKDSVVSRDGTIIGYRQIGNGPGVILVHGGMEASQHFTKLGEALADSFTVYILDRRGRGMSGAFGNNYSVERDCEDIAALAEKTGTENIFGLSSGAIITLRSALATPQLKKIALYEPPLSVDGSSPTQWVARYKRELADGKLPQALATVIKGIPISPFMARLPRFLLVPFLKLGIAVDEPKGDNVSIKSLIPTQAYDMVIVQETADTMSDYKTLQAKTLLLGGTKGPQFLRTTLDALEVTLPHATRTNFPGLDHLGATNEGEPVAVAQVLHGFFLQE